MFVWDFLKFVLEIPVCLCTVYEYRQAYMGDLNTVLFKKRLYDLDLGEG
jgi:hypothetical protein